MILITDLMEATGQGDGTYIRPRNRKVIVNNGEARLESGRLAGSHLVMGVAVQNAVNLDGLSIASTGRMASFNLAANLSLGQFG